MGQKTENYQNNFDYTDATLSGQVGFVTFQHLQDKEYYFRFNDDKGNPVLFSEGYGKVESLDKGAEAVLKNAGIAKRYKVLNEDGKWYATLRAGNHQEIARTKAFPKKTEADKMANWLAINLMAIKSGTLAAPPVKKDTLKNTDDAAPSVTTAANDPKYAFRIDLYPRQDEQLAGVITNILDNKNEKFRGVASDAITNFIVGSLSKKDRDMLPKPEAVKTEAEAKDITTEKPEPKQTLPETENLTVELVEGPDAMQKGNWATEEFISVRLKLKDGTNSPSGKKVNIKVQMYPLQNPAMAILVTTEADFTNGKTAFIKDLQQIRMPGLYRLNAISMDTQQGTPLYGTMILNVYN